METVSITLAVVVIVVMFLIISGLFQMNDRVIRERDEARRRLNITNKRIELLEYLNDQLIKIKTL